MVLNGFKYHHNDIEEAYIGNKSLKLAPFRSMDSKYIFGAFRWITLFIDLIWLQRVIVSGQAYSLVFLAQHPHIFVAFYSISSFV